MKLDEARELLRSDNSYVSITVTPNGDATCNTREMEIKRFQRENRKLRKMIQTREVHESIRFNNQMINRYKDHIKLDKLQEQQNQCRTLREFNRLDKQIDKLRAKINQS